MYEEAHCKADFFNSFRTNRHYHGAGVCFGTPLGGSMSKPVTAILYMTAAIPFESVPQSGTLRIVSSTDFFPSGLSVVT
jgi:hypothetical protein